MTTTIPESRTVTCDCCSKEIKPAMPSYSLAVPVEKRQEQLPSPSNGICTLLIACFRTVWDRKELDFCSPDCMEAWFRSAEFDQTHEHFKPAEAEPGITLKGNWTPLVERGEVHTLPASLQTGG